MPRNNKLAEVNNFTGGLVTEANPLAFPENASLDEENFELNNNGVRKRRLGFNYEPSNTSVNSGSQTMAYGLYATTSFLWQSPGGFTDKKFLVVQIGHKVQVFDTSISPLSSGVIYTVPLTLGEFATDRFSYAAIGTSLVIATGYANLYRLDWDGTSVSTTTIDIKVRDTVGVQASINSYSDVGDADLASFRPDPDNATPAYYYNLRNQGWGIPRPLNASWITDDDVYDPITAFLIQTGGGSISASSVLPSISDSVVAQLYPDANATTNKFIDRFVVMQSVKNPIGTMLAPKGHYIISATSRGSSRWSEFHRSESTFPELDVISTSGYATKADQYRPAKVVSSFAGRVFYGGMARLSAASSWDYDTRSPQVNTHIYFSQLVNKVGDIVKCYQEGDPTSKDAPDLIDTDGGFVVIKELDSVVGMVNIGKALLVVANNGVWSIAGGNNYAFSATNFSVTKITEHGCSSPGSIVVVDGSLMYWGDDGIYHIAYDQYNDLKATNISNAKINKLYNTITTSERSYVTSMYDTYERRVRWLYHSTIGVVDYTYELILDMNIGAYTKHRIGNYALTKVVGIAEVVPYKLASKDTYQRNIYIIDNDRTQAGSVNKNYSFGYYYDDTFYDWGSVDTPAYIQTGYNNSGTNLLNKQVPFLNVFLERTEDGFTASGGDFIPKHQSSCLVQTMWDWSDSVNSGRWGPQFQAYRYKRQYYASSVSDTYDYGQTVIETKNKLRGKGKVLSISFTTEPGKDCRIIGWSTMVSTDGRA